MSTEDDERSEGAGVSAARPNGKGSDTEQIQDDQPGHQGQDPPQDEDGGSSGAARTASSGRDVVVVERPRPTVTTDLTPYQGTLEPTSQEGLSIWGKMMKGPPGWTFPGATTDHI